MKYTGDISSSLSQKYQYLFREVLTTPFEMHDYYTCSQMDILNRLNENEVIELEKQLEDRLWQLIDTRLTRKQVAACQILKLAINENQGQVWMANQLGVNQSSIAKYFIGNTCYKGGVVKRYGGIAAKLTKIIQNDEVIHSLLYKLEDMETGDLRLPHYTCFRRIMGTATQYQNYLQTGKYVSYGEKE